MKNLKEIFKENMWVLQFDEDRMNVSGLEAYKDLKDVVDTYMDNAKRIEENPEIKKPILKAIRIALSNVYSSGAYDRISVSGKEALDTMQTAVHDAIREELKITSSLADQIKDAGSEKVVPETIDTKSKDLEI